MKENCQSVKAGKGTEKQKDHLWPKGVSGNPNGRKAGSRNKATLLVEAMLEGQLESVVRKVIERALQGNDTCLKLVLDRIYPLKEAPIHFALPKKIDNGEELLQASNSILQAVSKGEITTGDANKLSKILAQHAEHYERSELVRRLEALEQNQRYPG
jgi:hypothetical protein